MPESLTRSRDRAKSEERRKIIELRLKKATFVVGVLLGSVITIAQWITAHGVRVEQKRVVQAAEAKQELDALVMRRDGLREKRRMTNDKMVRMELDLRATMREAVDSRAKSFVVSQLMQLVTDSNEFEQAYAWQGQLMVSEVQIHRAISLMTQISKLRLRTSGHEKQIKIIDGLLSKENPEYSDVNHRIEDQIETIDHCIEDQIKTIDRDIKKHRVPEGGSAVDYFGLGVLLAQNGDFETSRHFVLKARREEFGKYKGEQKCDKYDSPYDGLTGVSAKLVVQCDILLTILNFVKDHSGLKPNKHNPYSENASDEGRELTFETLYCNVGKTKNWMNLQGRLLQAAIVCIWTELEAGQLGFSTRNGTGDLERANSRLVEVDDDLRKIGKSQFTNIVGVHQQLLDAAKSQYFLAKARAILDNDDLKQDQLETCNGSAADFTVRDALDGIEQRLFPAHHTIARDANLAADILRVRFHFAKATIAHKSPDRFQLELAQEIINGRILLTHDYAAEYAQLEFWRDVLEMALGPGSNKGDDGQANKVGPYWNDRLLKPKLSEWETSAIKQIIKLAKTTKDNKSE